MMKQLCVMLLLCLAMLCTACARDQAQTLTELDLNLSVDQLHVQFGNGQSIIFEDPNVINELNNLMTSSDYKSIEAPDGVGQLFTITWNAEMKYISTGYILYKSQLYKIMNTDLIDQINVYIEKSAAEVSQLND